jgi:hypothetical protein
MYQGGLVRVTFCNELFGCKTDASRDSLKYQNVRMKDDVTEEMVPGSEVFRAGSVPGGVSKVLIIQGYCFEPIPLSTSFHDNRWMPQQTDGGVGSSSSL